MLTPVAFTLLRQLADGGVHSGEALALTIGMTRARVSQLLKQVEGGPFTRAHSRPRLSTARSGAVSRSRRDLRSLDARAGPLQVEVADRSIRPAANCFAGIADSDIHRQLLAAEWQTAGRGRRGRGWTAVAGGSLTFSLGWRFEQGAGFLAGLSLAVGVALARALEASGFTESCSSGRTT